MLILTSKRAEFTTAIKKMSEKVSFKTWNYLFVGKQYDYIVELPKDLFSTLKGIYKIMFTLKVSQVLLANSTQEKGTPTLKTVLTTNGAVSSTSLVQQISLTVEQVSSRLIIKVINLSISCPLRKDVARKLVPLDLCNYTNARFV